MINNRVTEHFICADPSFVIESLEQLTEPTSNFRAKLNARLEKKRKIFFKNGYKGDIRRERYSTDSHFFIL